MIYDAPRNQLDAAEILFIRTISSYFVGGIMNEHTCSHCHALIDSAAHGCPQCGAVAEQYDADARLKAHAARVREERMSDGREGLIGGLVCAVINVEPARVLTATRELLATTGMACREAFESETAMAYVLATEGSADLIVRARTSGANPFAAANNYPLARRLPNTRLELLVFEAYDLERYVALQQERGVHFLTEEVVRTDRGLFIQTVPSAYTGNSLGFIERTTGKRAYGTKGCRPLALPQKPARPYLSHIGRIDHIATRLLARDRDPAIVEFMELTSYNFEFAIYVATLNSITNVARRVSGECAHVFTSGIAPFVDEAHSGPTERFVHRYGPRVHHIAFHTDHIEETCDALAADGMRYLVELVGSPEEGLKQTFTMPSEHTMLVNEYIYRYGDFDGFFTKSNVTKLTAATD